LATGVPDARVPGEDDGVGVPPGAEDGSVGLGVARRLIERIARPEVRARAHHVGRRPARRRDVLTLPG
jgi:hypothetical protein